MQNGKRFEWAPVFPVAEATRQGSATQSQQPPSRAMLAYASADLLQTFRAWQVQQLSTVFLDASALVSLPMPSGVAQDEVLVRRVYTGANASDINFTSGKYFGSTAEATKQLPFIAGFESVGVVVKAGAATGTRLLRLRTPVLVLHSSTCTCSPVLVLVLRYCTCPPVLVLLSAGCQQGCLYRTHALIVVKGVAFVAIKLAARTMWGSGDLQFVHGFVCCNISKKSSSSEHTVAHAAAARGALC